MKIKGPYIRCSRYERVASKNGSFLLCVGHSDGGKAQLCGARINGGGSYVVRGMGGSVDISYLASIQAGLAETF